MIKKYKIFLVGVISGIVLISIGLVFNVIFAGIPYQSDAPDYLKLQYINNKNIANLIYVLGLAIIIIGLIIQIIVSLRKK